MSLHKSRVVEQQDFTAVITVGYGENLYPLNQGTHVVSKALLPIGNAPIMNLVLNWVLDAGLRDILLIVPPAYYTPISNHISENYSMVTHPKARISLKRYTDGDAEADEEPGGMQSEGTARLLKRFSSYIKSDFVLLPCDLAPPKSLKLASVLDKHRSSPKAVLTSVFYEPVESVKEAGEKILVAMDKSTSELLLVQPVDANEDDLDLRTTLARKHPSASWSTRLQDAHIYVLRREFLDLIATRRSRDLDSLREQVIPWLCKTAWQKGLTQKCSEALESPNRDPLAGAIARSTTSKDPISAETQQTPPSNSRTPLPSSSLPSPSNNTPEPREEWAIKPVKSGYKCQIVITAPAPPPAPEPTPKGKDKSKAIPVEPDHLIRANSLAGYWELNRRVIRSLAGSTPAPTPRSSAIRDADDNAPISPSAQISPDSLIGEGTRVGDKASIKKCVVGRHCVIGKGAKLTGCVLWDFVTVEENAKIENTILCSNVRIGAKSQIKDCEFGTGFEAVPESVLKGERLIAGQVA